MKAGTSPDGPSIESPGFGLAEQGAFLARFLLLFGLLNAAVWAAHEQVFSRFIDLTSRLSSALSNAVGIAASWGPDFVVVSGYELRVDAECTALAFLLIYAAGVLSHPRHPWAHKLKGLLFGGAFLVLANVVRIVSLGVIGAHSTRAVVDVVHLYLWQGAYVVLLVPTWAVWAREGARKGRRDVRPLAAAALAAFLGLLVAGALMKPYMLVLTKVANALIAVADRNVEITATGTRVVVAASTLLIKYDLLEVYDVVIYLVLVAATGVGARRTNIVQALLLGCGALFLLHLSFVFVLWQMLSHTLAAARIDDVCWFMRVTALVAPVVLWAVARRTPAGGGRLTSTGVLA